MMSTKPEPGTYQTTIRVERWELEHSPSVRYSTTFAGKTKDHNKLFDLVRKLHGDKDGEASALIDIFEKAGKFAGLEERIKELEEELKDADRMRLDV